MVGKLNLDLGDDYAYDIRRAREVAEGGATGNDGLGPGEQAGPFLSSGGAKYWFKRDSRGVWYIGFDVDVDPDPDIFIQYREFLRNPTIDQQSKNETQDTARMLGWPG